MAEMRPFVVRQRMTPEPPDECEVEANTGVARARRRPENKRPARGQAGIPVETRRS